MTDIEEMEQEFMTWVKMLRIGIETNDKNVSMFALREIESIISRVCYAFDLPGDMDVGMKVSA